MQQTDSAGEVFVADGQHVPESRFGQWFLRTDTWATHVLERAIKDLERLIPGRKPAYPVIVDVGCGWGRSFRLLHGRFAPQRLIGVDVDPRMIQAARAEVERHGIAVDFRNANSSHLPLANESVDMIFCHQTFHHIVEQEEALREFHRILKPGGVMLFAESTRKYIHSWIIRLLFRHPMDVQRTAGEYLAMIDRCGFEVGRQSLSYPYLWWSRPDLGILERWFGVAPPPSREETLINLVAVRR
ncbi:MAG: class I SAM-dependent methyltransferase [Nevskia sp.]|nr:class I SAM-dependent methyltransferase [Nevskia sp.]